MTTRLIGSAECLQGKSGASDVDAAASDDSWRNDAFTTFGRISLCLASCHGLAALLTRAMMEALLDTLTRVSSDQLKFADRRRELCRNVPRAPY